MASSSIYEQEGRSSPQHGHDYWWDLRKIVYPPLENATTCDYCEKKAEEGKKLPLCGRCGESAYCNATCQKLAWTKYHKDECGKTDRINTGALYPLLAVIIDDFRVDNRRTPHPALTHRITNSPNPPTAPGINLGVLDVPYPLPEECGGGSSRVIFLGEPVDMSAAVGPGNTRWWPTALSDEVRHKLVRRFVTEGYILPSIVATLTALLGEVYTMTYRSSLETLNERMTRRVRLQHKGSPVCDFGIVKGRAKIPPIDTFAYCDLSEKGQSEEDKEGGGFLRIADPNDHYWIYFTTLSGEELYLDCGLFCWNICPMVNTAAYIKYGLDAGSFFAPAYLCDSNPKNAEPCLHIHDGGERERFSVLRDKGLQECVTFKHGESVGSDEGIAMMKILCGFMDRVAGRTCSDNEKMLAMSWYKRARDIIGANVETREYLNYPQTHTVVNPGDPGQKVLERSEKAKKKDPMGFARAGYETKEEAAAMLSVLKELRDRDRAAAAQGDPAIAMIAEQIGRMRGR